MKEAGVKPDNRTLTLVLSSCASIGALDLGKWVDTYVSQLSMKHDIYINTALLDMYAKCGSLDEALRTFEEMPQKNEASWNAMISALASHGRATEALMLFEHMLKEGGSICPSDITFIHVLSACVHAGLVDEGRRIFGLMNLFGLVPKVEHFSCMVDLFSRAGLLYEAWEFIEKMPGKPDEITLGALHGACQKRRNTEVGERVIQLILEIEPSNSGNYIISSKLYADVNRLDDAARMRLLMREKGVVKLPGCSWIEIEGQHFEFHAGDQPHEITSGVYVALVDEMRREGYIPNLKSDFLNAAENEEML